VVSVKSEELASQFELLARLLKVWRDNPFKIRSYEFAAKTIRSRLPDGEIDEDSIKSLSQIKGIGKAIQEKSLQYLHEGKIEKIEELRTDTPKSIYRLIVDGKIETGILAFLWKDAGLTKPEELLEFLTRRRDELKLNTEDLSRFEKLLIP
jgi:DNA polymerase (family 10)